MFKIFEHGQNFFEHVQNFSTHSKFFEHVQKFLDRADGQGIRNKMYWGKKKTMRSEIREERGAFLVLKP